ncbi:MAG: SAM-dependent methyltransferase, partial [Nitrososphaera sp.]
LELMSKPATVDDVTLSDEDDLGPPILFANPQIRRMMKLAGVGQDDIFYDLGCGWGQNLIIAVTEFHVKKALGLEKHTSRYEKAGERIKEWGISRNCEVIKEDFEKALSGKSKNAKLEEATVVFYGLGTSSKIINKLKKRLRTGCRFVYYYNCLFPEIMPEKSDYPFLVSTMPFESTHSERAWLLKVTNKRKSSLRREKKPAIEELWDEIHHDHDIESTFDEISEYRERMAKTLKRK